MVTIVLPPLPINRLDSAANIAALRAVASASLENGQDIAVDGSVTVGDGLGGIYTWSELSVLADNGTTVIKPTDVLPLAAGRWILISASGNTQAQYITTQDFTGAIIPDGSDVQQALQALETTAEAHMRLNVPGVSNQGYDYRLMETVESIDGTSAGAGKVDALRIAHTFGGSTAKGGRHAIETFAIIISPTASDNPDRNYVGGAFTGLATSSDGGGVGTERGALFGVNGVGRLASGATNWLNVTGGEFNTECVAGSSVTYKSGIQICGFATDTVQGSAYDAMISLSRQVGGVVFRDGILFSEANGLSPVGTGSTLLRTQGAATCDSGVDIGSYLFTKQAIRVGATASAQQAGIGIRQQGNGSVGLFLQRNTDAAPAGNIIQVVNADNSIVLFSVDAAGNVTGGNVTTALVANGSGTIAIGDASGEVQMNKPLVAPGGGAGASLGSIGGSGPVTATQNSWMRFLDQSGAICWVPVWK